MLAGTMRSAVGRGRRTPPRSRIALNRGAVRRPRPTRRTQKSIPTTTAMRSSPGGTQLRASLAEGRWYGFAALMQKTLIIFKPDCMNQRHVGNVIDRFEQAGLTIVGCKLMRLAPALLRGHYAHVADRPFYPSLEAFMSSRPVIVMALAGAVSYTHLTLPTKRIV